LRSIPAAASTFAAFELTRAHMQLMEYGNGVRTILNFRWCRAFVFAALAAVIPNQARRKALPRGYLITTRGAPDPAEWKSLTSPFANNTAAIVGCPFRGGQPRLGVDKGPIHLVEAGLIDQLKELGWNVKFDGHHQFEEITAQNDPPIGKLKNPRFVSHVCRSVANVIGEHAKKGELPVALGGDHSL
ncbi:hypothetical protein MPER_06441, partial [Moniliophthora perniciosa FA553]